MLVAPMMAALALISQAGAPWKTVVSKEGQFAIAFPAAPTETESRTANGPGGRAQAFMIACETSTAKYIVEKIILPTAVVRGAEENHLNQYRDFFARELHGRVISEKRVHQEGRIARDYTLRAQPERNGPVVTVRLRQYLIGQAMFFVYVVSNPNRELPGDVGQFLGSFTLPTDRTKVAAARPEAEGRPLEGWGLAVDPDGDCKIVPDGKSLTIDVPGKLHDLNTDKALFNAPRIVWPVDGDFSVQVKVSGSFAPGPKGSMPNVVSFTGAGLFCWLDSNNFIRFERASMYGKNGANSFALFEEREGGSGGALHPGPLTPGDAYLRLERRGGRVFGFTSKDGKNWVALRPIDINWPAKARVGIHVISSTAIPIKVRFEEFSLKGNGAARP